MWTQSRRLMLGVAAALLATSCLAPTLPLPPPSDPEVVGPNAQGLVRLRGRAPEKSWVTAYNRVTERGVLQAADDGSYDLEIAAQVGDSIAIWYEIGGKTSEPLDVTIR